VRVSTECPGECDLPGRGNHRLDGDRIEDCTTPPRRPSIRVNLLQAHGSPTRHLYTHHGCRCVACRGADAAYGRKYRAERTDDEAARKRKYNAEHAEGEAKRKRRYRAEHPEMLVEWRRRTEYGLAFGQWEAQFLSQGERCKCCGTDDPGHKFGWQTDHDHKTGAVRGILCHGCNTGLGSFKDDPERLMAAIEYLACER